MLVMVIKYNILFSHWSLNSFILVSIIISSLCFINHQTLRVFQTPSYHLGSIKSELMLSLSLTFFYTHKHLSNFYFTGRKKKAICLHHCFKYN